MPEAMDAPVGDEPDVQVLLGAGQSDIGQPAFFLEAGPAAFVQRALVREQSFLPAGQKHGLEFEALGRVQRHDVDGVEIFVLLGVHDQCDMFEEGAQRLVLLHGADQLFQVFQPARRFGRTVGLPHLRVAGLVEDFLGEFGVRRGFDQRLASVRNWPRPRAMRRAAWASARRFR